MAMSNSRSRSPKDSREDSDTWRVINVMDGTPTGRMDRAAAFREVAVFVALDLVDFNDGIDGVGESGDEEDDSLAVDEDRPFLARCRFKCLQRSG